ncbi:MarR family transcriptional regulator [Loigolactobacillus zhaoyuanensis]|uniref:MarR family transcriptional regulator n=1 Tax=Loigolactobacillus zhaoyuanensis TaxID=2486017 RepID=A0ABW8UAH5_9LACO|nr:MarR family transcriptional regulator [Loigolactobacillus zhaoyuanensis]
MDKINYFKQVIEPTLLQVATTTASNSSFEQEWLLKRLNTTPEWQQVLNNLPLLSLHTLADIGKNQPVNGTELTAHLQVSKGAISKTVNKLIKFSLIDKFKRTDNRKEVYYSLTEKGQQLNYAHQQLHQQLDQQMQQLLAGYQPDQLELVAQFVQQIQDLHNAPIISE